MIHYHEREIENAKRHALIFQSRTQAIKLPSFDAYSPSCGPYMLVPEKEKPSLFTLIKNFLLP